MMKKQRTCERDIYEAFKLYDKDNSGVISVKDLQHILTRTGDRLSQQECKDFHLSEYVNLQKYLVLISCLKSHNFIGLMIVLKE